MMCSNWQLYMQNDLKWSLTMIQKDFKFLLGGKGAITNIKQCTTILMRIMAARVTMTNTWIFTNHTFWYRQTLSADIERWLRLKSHLLSPNHFHNWLSSHCLHFYWTAAGNVFGWHSFQANTERLWRFVAQSKFLIVI